MNVKVRDVMSAHPISVRKNASFKEIAARLMYTRGLKRLPVIDSDARLTGVVSRTDVLQGVVAVRDRLVYPLPPVTVTSGPSF